MILSNGSSSLRGGGGGKDQKEEKEKEEEDDRREDEGESRVDGGRKQESERVTGEGRSYNL